jgi:response regulator RpfG family c-di-GMP phosphodiesterase
MSVKCAGAVLGSVNPLRGHTVLIVEDEPLIGLELHAGAAGASCLAATSIKEALQLISYTQICAAILDVKLGGRDCSSVCAALTKRSIPFMFYTGYQTGDVISTWPNAAAVSKPAPASTIVDTIVQLLPSGNAIGATDHGSSRRWKFSESDYAKRELWPRYIKAYDDVSAHEHQAFPLVYHSGQPQMVLQPCQFRDRCPND